MASSDNYKPLKSYSGTHKEMMTSPNGVYEIFLLFYKNICL